MDHTVKRLFAAQNKVFQNIREKVKEAFLISKWGKWDVMVQCKRNTSKNFRIQI